MKRALGILMLTLLVFSMAPGAFAGRTKVIEKRFEGIESLKIETVLGGCVIRRGSGDGISIRVEHDYEEGQFEARFSERGNVLYVEEDLDGEDIDGGSEWLIVVPADIDIRFESATGGLEAAGISGRLKVKSGTGCFVISGFEGEIEANSGTGSIKIEDSKGDFELGSGTGSVTVRGSSGSFSAESGTGNVTIDGASGDIEASSGTGHVEAFELMLEEFGEFSSGTGNAEVKLPKGDAYELEVSSGTGRARLDCGGADLDAYVEMSAKKRSGRISSFLDFEDEEEYFRGDDKYVRKWFTKGSGTRKIEIRTGTGSAKLAK